MEDGNTASTRIASWLEHKGLNANAAATKLGYANASKMYKILQGTSPGFDTLVEFLTAWPELSADWLLLGQGPMVRATDAPAQAATTPVQAMAAWHGRGVTSGKVLAVTVDRAGQDNIVHVPIRAQAGYAHSYDEPACVQDLVPYSLPILTHGTFRSFDVEGDSMLPTFGHCDIVIGEFVERWDLLRPGHCYVVVLVDNVLLKRINKPITARRGQQVELLSDNKLHLTYSVPAEDIVELWHVRARLSTNIPAAPGRDESAMYELMQVMGADFRTLRRFIEENAPADATH